MAILIRRAVVREDQESTYVDVELDADVLSIGSSSGNAVQLSGPMVAESHAEIRVGSASGGVEFRSFGRAVSKVNGASAQRKTLVVGDVIEIGANVLELLDPPPGFSLALSVLVDESAAEGDLEQSFRTTLGQTWLSKRVLAWVLVLLVAVVGLLAPWVLESNNTLQQSGITPSEIWSAGPLHLAHQNATQGQCNACHTEPFVRVEDSACQQCHTTLVEHPEPAQLQQPTATGPDRTAPRCASCHLEHSEPRFLISPATDHCEGCHEVTSFAADHPDFDSYPNIGRTRTMFDHGQHAGKHFGKTEREFECAQCHQLDDSGQAMMARSFADMCVGCHGAKESTRANLLFHHGDQISKDEGVAFFTLPRLDLKTLGLDTSAVELGYWPPATKGGSRAGLTRLGLTEITELLLSFDPQALSALEHLRNKKTKLASLRRASPQELAAIGVVVPALKTLLAELAENPEATVAKRLEPWLSRELSARELTALVGGLMSSVVQQAASGWFAQDPGFLESKDIQAYLGGIADSDVKSVLARLSSAAPGLGGIQLGQWEAQKFSLQYDLSGHGDDFAKAWIALAAELNEVTALTDTPEPLRDSVKAVYDLFLDSSAKPGAAKGVGRCTKCHDLKQSDPKQLFADLPWQGSWRERMQVGTALFTHKAHLRSEDGSLQNDAESCGQCHKPTKNADYLVQSYTVAGDLSANTAAVANFEALSPGECSQCHKPKTAAGDACLQCHAYHPRSANGADFHGGPSQPGRIAPQK